MGGSGYGGRGGVPDQCKECFEGSRGIFFSPPLFGLSLNSTGRLRFALAKCYKCFDNLVSDPQGSPGRARGVQRLYAQRFNKAA